MAQLEASPGSAASVDEQGLSIEGAQSWRVALAAMACLVFGPSSILVAGFGVFIGPIARDGGWTPGQVALAISFTALVMMVVTPLQGWLTDRFGARRVVLVSIPLFAGGLTAMYFTPKNLTAFYLMWTALPVLGLGLFPTAYLKAVGGWFDRRLGFALGLTNAGFGVGAVLMPLIGGGLIATLGWRAAFVVLGGLALLTLPVAFLFLRESPWAAAKRAQGASASESVDAALTVRGLLRDPLFRKLAVGYGLMGFAGTGFAANLVPMAMSGGASAAQAVSLQALYGAVALVGRLVTGRLLDSIFAARLIGAIVAAACAACVVFVLGLSGWPVVVAVVFHGLLLGAEFDVLAYVVRRNWRIAAFGRVYGITFAMFQAGASLGAAFLAISAQRTGGYGLGMGVYAAALALSLIPFLRLEPYRLSRFEHR